jgi:hypothetical protein
MNNKIDKANGDSRKLWKVMNSGRNNTDKTKSKDIIDELNNEGFTHYCKYNEFIFSINR